ncbi:MAG: hypothetical protein ACFFBI_12070 [Promethearchaeota archaeon]
MNIKISSGSSFSNNYFEFNTKIIGAGTIDNPYLITTKNVYPYDYYEIRISNSSDYIKFEGIFLKALYLDQCKNIQISKSRLNKLELGKCSKISIKDVSIYKNLKLENVQQIKIKNCRIKKLFAFTGDQILITNCEIKRISRKSKALIYIKEKNEISCYKNISTQVRNQLKHNFWTCPYCNSELDMNSIFCYECGSRLKIND